MEKYDNTFTPTLSFKYSPNKTKDLRHENKRIDINNIYSIDRLGVNNAIEGGQSVTIGGGFKKTDKLDNNFLKFDLATSFRDKKNEDMPLTSTMGDRQSDLVGKFTLKPNGIFNVFISSIAFSIISGETHAATKPNQFLLLHFLTISVMLSPDGSLLLFLMWTPTKTGKFIFSVASNAILTSLTLDKTSR